jgi:glycosyltransferase involved in cell wall biosynthesis
VTVPRVSVLLASRDGARYLRESLSSLVAQRCDGVEVVAVDDGSRDETAAVLAEFAASRPDWVVLSTPGVGLAAALDLAAQRARSELLARQDDDDRSHPERLARQADHLARHAGVAVVGTRARVIGSQGEPLADYDVPVDEPAIRRTLRRATPFVHGSVMMRATAYRAAGGYRAAFAASQDYDLWLRLPPEAGLANLLEPLYEWRRHPRGVFTRDRASQLRFAAIARAFARERAESGADSYAQLEHAPGFDAFVTGYRHRDRLALLLGETYAREGLVSEARRWLRRGLGSPRTSLAAAAWWGLTFAVALTPRARRHHGEAAA